MEVDHFNPRKKNDYAQHYSNLFLATRHCNGAKRDRWPTCRERKLGARFLNCCEETDFGVHIFEDPDSHEVVGVTPEGKYHVRNCDLNAPHLVEERTQRADLWSKLEGKAMRIKDGRSLPDVMPVLGIIEALKEVAIKMIPRIPYLSGEALENHRARKRALAAVATEQTVL